MGVWRTLWKELVVGVVIDGRTKRFVPKSVWDQLFSIFSEGTLAWVVLGGDRCRHVRLLGRERLTCARALASGIPFGGVMSYIFADLIIPHIVQMYHKFYGWRMAATMFVLIFVAAALSGLVLGLLLHLFDHIRLLEVAGECENGGGP